MAENGRKRQRSNLGLFWGAYCIFRLYFTLKVQSRPSLRLGIKKPKPLANPWAGPLVRPLVRPLESPEAQMAQPRLNVRGELSSIMRASSLEFTDDDPCMIFEPNAAGLQAHKPTSTPAASHDELVQVILNAGMRVRVDLSLTKHTQCAMLFV